MDKKVLIVDDEPFICRGLRVLIERSGLSFNIIEESPNGLDALEKLKRDKYDLMIADIRMPHMDGLELLKRLQDSDIKISKIILSGHDDFHYAKEAIKYGLSNYLLKPVDRFELQSALEKAEKEIEQAEEMTAQSNSYQRLLSNELNYILLNDNLKEEEIKAILETTKTNILFDDYYMAAIYIIKDIQTHVNCMKDSDILINDFLNGEDMQYLLFYDSSVNLVLITSSLPDYKALLLKLSEHNKSDVFIGYSIGKNGVEDFRQTYMNALKALKERFICDGFVFKWNEEEIYGNTAINMDQIIKAAEMVGTDRLQDIYEIIDGLFYPNGGHICIDYIEKTTEAINKHIINAYLNNYMNTNNEKHTLSLCENPYSFARLSNYIESLKECIRYIDDAVHNKKKEYRQLDSIDKAIKWIDDNFKRKDLSMTIVSNEVSLNYSYFSFAFKEKTGMSFVMYLKKKRIEEAKKLLRESDIKIKDVADRVGFQSTALFSKTFREEVGISPAEYIRYGINTKTQGGV